MKGKLAKIGKKVLGHQGFFSLDQICEETGIRRKYVGDVLAIFMREGLLKRVLQVKQEHRPGLSPRFATVYLVLDKEALERRISPRLREGTAQDRLWVVIRTRKCFDLRDLIILGSVKRRMARYYLSALRRKGIICPSRTGGGPGVSWTLIKDVGIKRPNVSSSG